MEFTNIVTLGDGNEVLMEEINLCSAFESGIIDTMTMCTFDRSFTTPRKVIEDPARYAVTFDNRIPCKDVVISVDEWRNPLISTFGNGFKGEVKSVGYIYHGRKEILDLVSKNHLVADIKPWFPAVNSHGMTLTDIINICKPTTKMFETICRRGKLTVKLLGKGVKGTVDAKLISREPSKGYRTIFDKMGFAMKIINTTDCDCEIIYANDLTYIEEMMKYLNSEFGNYCRTRLEVNNGNGTFYDVTDAVVKR